MLKNKWGEATAAYHAGAIDFAQFERTTRADRKKWVGSARWRLRPIPVWHAKEDSEQDFLLTLFLKRSTFDPERSTAGGYFRHGIYDVGKKIQKARGVEQHRRSGPAMFERTFASLAIESHVDLSPATDATGEKAAIRSEYYEILRALCDTGEQLAVVCALQACGGTLAGATGHLFGDRHLRRRFGISSLRQATEMVDRVVDELVAAYGKKDEAQ